MAEEYLINCTPQETRIALIEQGVVQELHIERTHARGLVGNVYWGRVARVLPGMQSAFIDIGLTRTAFLHVADVQGAQDDEGGQRAPIERMLTAGQCLLVQVIKDPIGSKGARLTTHISLAGRLLVYLPGETHIGISQRISDEGERERLRTLIQTLVPGDHRGGYILRTRASGAPSADLLTDIAYLDGLWLEIQTQTQLAQAPALLHADLCLAQRILRDLVGPETERIRVDSRENRDLLMAFAARYLPQGEIRIEHYTGERMLFELYNVDDEIQKALARRVDLKSGGYLMIDQTEAMATIDVNTGAFVGARNFDETIFKTNLEAAQAIARQLRLRNLGGIIIIDFIDMGSATHRDAVLAALRKALSRDRTRVTVSEFSQLGLVELTRKRTRESLSQVLCEPCPTCGGRGDIRSTQTVCYDILREVLRESRQFPAREYRVLAAAHVVDWLLDEEPTALSLLSDFIGKPISLQPEPGYGQEQYDIVLL
jgi:ribonuclease G